MRRTRRLPLSPRAEPRLPALLAVSAILLGGCSQVMSQEDNIMDGGNSGAGAVKECSAEESIVIKRGGCDPSNKTKCDALCGLHGSEYLKGKCCAHVGHSASLLAFEEDDQWVPRIDEFNRCTGASVRLEYLAEGEDGMAEALKRDVGAADDPNSGEGIYDSYIVQGPWLPAVVAGLLNLSPLIKENADVVNFQDINPASRSAVSYNGTVRALPLDTDYIAIGWREDVFAKHGLPLEPPKTIEELADLSERLNGLDHNDDGQPDWGFCLTPQVNYFYAFVATIFQTNLFECTGSGASKKCTGPAHTGQNLFFDSMTFQPLIRNDGFRYALEQYWRIIRASNCQEETANGRKCDRKTAFPTGRCAGVISMPGTLTKMLLEGEKYAPEPRVDADGNVVWRVGQDLPEGRYWGRRAAFPGSDRVMVWDGSRPDRLEPCTDDTCPLASDGVNRAPFFAEGGEAYSINGRQSKPAARNVMWDLFTWLSELPVNELPLSGQYRKSHIEGDEHRNELLADGWPAQMVDDLFEVLGKYFKGEDEGGNPVQDLLMLGFDDYMDVLNDELHKKLLLASIDDGGLFNMKDPKASLDPQKESDAAAFNERYDRFVNALDERYDAVNKETSGGALGQLQRWRQSLNLPWRTDMEICTELLNTNLEAFRNLECATSESVSLETLCATNQAAVEAYQAGTCGSDDRGKMIAIVVVSSVLGAVVVGFGIWFLYNRWKKFRRIAVAHEQLMEDTIDEAQRSLTQLDYPLHLIRGADFVNEESLVQHEKLRNAHKLIVLDSLPDVDSFITSRRLIVFFSHQWTSFKAPDPSGKQFEAMCAALRYIAKQNGLDENLESIYVWVDFSCIPQANPSTQNLAIRSLATYASSASVFVVIAPTCGHADLDTPCDVRTYQRRMWCRAEQVCHSMRNGTDKMHLATDEGLVPIGEEWFKEALHVFDGELTCCRLEHRGMAACDRQSLVIPLLGLYGELYRASVEGGGDDAATASVAEFLGEIDMKQESIFPCIFERVSWRKDKKVKEQVLLFGDLIERMRQRVKNGKGAGNPHGKSSGVASGARHGSDFLRHGVMHGVNPELSNVKVETVVGTVNKEDDWKEDLYEKV